MALLEDIVFV